MAASARVFCLTVMAFFIWGCTLPGATSPTPFTFPTPNLTLTAVFAPTATPSPAPPTLPPLELSPSPTIEITLPASPTATPTVEFDTRPNGSPLTATFLGSPPAIDGSLGEWTSPTFRVNQITYGTSDWSGAGDLSGTLYLGWDNDNLYVAVRITDDIFVQNSQGDQMYRGDEVEIQLDTDLAGDFQASSLNSDDYQIGLSPGNFGSRSPEAYRWLPEGNQGPLGSVEIGAVSTSDGYDLEAKIPWAVFGVFPNAGSRFGFVLSLSDNDLTGSSVQQSMVSTLSSRIFDDPTSWGTLILGSP